MNVDSTILRRLKDEFGETFYLLDSAQFKKNYIEILYLIFDYPHKHHTFKHFEVQKIIQFTTNLPRLNEP